MPYLGQQRPLLPSAQVSQLTTGRIALPSASQKARNNITIAYYVLGGGGSGSGGGFTNNGGGGSGGGHSYSASEAVELGVPLAVTVGSTGTGSIFHIFGATGGRSGTSSEGGTGNAAVAGKGITQSGGAGGIPTINGTPGNGGAGYTNPIDSVARGGGGGGTRKGQTPGNGADGGTAGSNASQNNPNPAAAGSGGGGGGLSTDNFNGSLGGSGRIILKIPDTNNASFSAGVTANTTTGGGFKTIQVTAGGASDTVTFG